MQTHGGGDGPAGSRALEQYRKRAPVYDAEVAPLAPVRLATIGRLDLRSGDRVIDVGCGTGLSFEELRGRVGARGRVIGVEPVPDMLERARARVARHRWRNVDLVPGFAAEAPLHGKADAALFMFTHDVLRDPSALTHVLAHLRQGARVAAAGLQWAPPWLWPTNFFVLLAALYSVSSLQGMARPWDLLAGQLAGLQVQTTGFGAIYIARGTLA
jgi:demethylmenaquinone methyltransferase/2-methoxy-6-polyprenyl-1,4-benzoquinol methylase